MKREVIHGDCLEVMPTLEADSIDAIVTDPPYGLAFMGKDWDHGVPGEHFWREALRVAKPGAHLVAFGGTRTYHRLAVAIEDAGWEIRDCLGWLYGSGFPKSLDVGDGRGTALKPAWEPIILARKPLGSTVAECVQRNGTGALNIDGCRVGTGGHLKWASPRNMGYHGGSDSGSVDATESPLGRWPANIVHDGSDEVLAVMGDAARFFYCAKASKADREEGLVGDERRGGPEQFDSRWKDGIGDDRMPMRRNHHPTVKPTDLMRWLVRLVTPPDGTVLDPFCGSGSTGKAAVMEGLAFVGIEQDEAYAEIARARIEHAATIPIQGSIL